MGKTSRTKGKVGERELAKKFREHGFDAKRGQQYCGANGDADVIGLPGIHVECKRVERFQLYDAMAQAKSDARQGEMPVVFHRRNHCEWVAVQPLDDWIELYKEGYGGICSTKPIAVAPSRKATDIYTLDCGHTVIVPANSGVPNYCSECGKVVL